MSETLVEQLREVGNNTSSKPTCQRVFAILHGAEDCFDTPCNTCTIWADLANRIEAEYTPNSEIEAKHMPYPLDADGVPCTWGDNVFGEDCRKEEYGQVKGWQKDNVGRWYVTVSGVSHERVWIASKCHHVKPPKRLTKKDIANMASMSCGDYWKCDLCDDCENCPSKINGEMPTVFYGVDDCFQAQILDILRKERERVAGEKEEK